MPNCPSCNNEVPSGSRWCPICHKNIVNKDLGALASPGKRLGAYFLDVLVPYITIFLVFSVAGFGFFTGKEEGSGLRMFIAFVIDITYIIIAFVLFARGTTPGKRILGMRVIKEDGRRAGFFTMLFREVIGKFISGIIFFLGYLWILFDKENQGWHDKLMSTYVIKS